MTPRTSIARLADDAPVPHPELNDVTPTSAEMAAVRFVKEMAAHVDQKHGRLPTRETQKKVASVVREKFFDPEPAADSWPSRKPPFVSYADCPDCGATKAETSVLGFWCEHDRCPIFAKPSLPSVAMASTCASIRAQAARTVRLFVKVRARDYLDEPWQLDMLRGGFVASGFTPGQLIEFAKEVLRQELEFCEKMAPHRIELVPVKNWNARAAIIAGRYRRAKAGQIARRAP